MGDGGNAGLFIIDFIINKYIIIYISFSEEAYNED